MQIYTALTQNKQRINTKRKTTNLGSIDSSAVVEISLHMEACIFQLS